MAQKSAAGIVGMRSRFTRLRHSPERGETAGLARTGNGTLKAQTAPREGLMERQVGRTTHGWKAAENPDRTGLHDREQG